MMGKIPDITGKIMGATGNTSGIALKLMFHAMEQAAGGFIHNFKSGVRARIDLLNRVWGPLGQPVLAGYDVEIIPNLPVNELELYDRIPVLRMALSSREVLKRLPSVTNPDGSSAEFLAEAEKFPEVHGLASSSGGSAPPVV